MHLGVIFPFIDKPPLTIILVEGDIPRSTWGNDDG